MLGFTPFTVAGFALSAVLIVCNSLLGTGWASELLFGPEVVTVPDRLSPSLKVPSNVLNGDESTIVGPGLDLDPLVRERLLQMYRQQ